MGNMIMQAAEAGSIADAERIERALTELLAAYVAFERSHAAPWDPATILAPLVAFGEQHGVAWPDHRDARFLLKGAFADVAHVLRVDRLVFFWGGGFDLGGEWLREVLAKIGAITCTDRPLVSVRCDDPDARIEELSRFLIDEDFEDQFALDAPNHEALFTVTLVNGDRHRTLVFDHSGVQDQAFVSLLPQLDGEDPTFTAA